MTEGNGTNGRVTLAILKNEIGHIKQSHQDIKEDVKEIKNILVKGDGKIADNRIEIAVVDTKVEKVKSASQTAWKLFSAVISVFAIIVTIAFGAFK